VAREGVREKKPGLDVLAHLLEDFGELRVLDLLLEHVECPQQGHAGRHHGGQLAGHDRQIGGLDPLGQELDLELEAAGLLGDIGHREPAAFELVEDGLLGLALEDALVRQPVASTA
jgi:hypothetical protein